MIRHRALVLVTLGAIGLAAELALTEHWHDTWQIIPFAACAALAFAAVFCLLRPRAALPFARGVAIVALIAAMVGVGQHLWANGTFTAEIRPSFTTSQLIVPAFLGASPALAPGALGLLAAFLWLMAPPPTEA